MKLRQSMKPANNSFEHRLGGDFVSRVFFAVYCYDELVCKILLRESNWTTVAAKSFALIVYWLSLLDVAVAQLRYPELIRLKEDPNTLFIHTCLGKNVKKNKKKQHRKSKQNKIQYRTLNSKSGREKCSMADVMTCPDKERKNEHNLTK